MLQVHTPTKGIRRFYILSAILVSVVPSAIVATAALTLLLGPTQSLSQGLIYLLLACNLVGHKLRNYLWANVVGASILLVTNLVYRPEHGHALKDSIIALIVIACALLNAKSMLVIRENLGV